MNSVSQIRAAWLAQLFSTEPAERPRAEAGLRGLYAAGGFGEPRHILWFDSPFAASWVVALLAAPHHQLWGQTLSSSALSRDERQRADQVRAILMERFAAANWDDVLRIVGGPLGSSLQFPPVPSRMFQTKLFEARYSLSDDISAMIARHTLEDDLQRAEQRFWGGNLGALVSAQHCPTTSTLIGQSFVADYPFSMMAHDQEQVGDGPPPALMESGWEVARSSGLWWPFERAAIMSERPAEIHVNDEKLLHRGDGPAVVFRDGSRVYAWNGKAVPERWIMHPEDVPAREFKGFDPTFGQYVASKLGTSASRSGKRPKPSTILKMVLSNDPVVRLQQLRAHAGGALPLFDRYQGGEHQQVWSQLVAQGANVREDPHSADALAVAYETMTRVEANVRTIVGRLEAMHYAFKDRPHVSPPPGVGREIADFEKNTGPLPLSLRAFYEVVGEVNLIGRHPTLSPRKGNVPPDPLVVYGFEEGLVEFDEDEEDAPSAITIAPDDLHKADTSGGDAYEMKIPDVRADGELLNERHRLFFVDYLRLCFTWGGFPGYEGIATAPAEIGALKAGLLEF